MFDRARKTQAKNDVTQIATAVNAFYTEYGQYPIPSASQGSDYQILANDNSVVINALRASAADTLNTRKIVFLSPPQASGTPARSAVVQTSGIYYDPWSGVYQVEIDGSYDNSLANPYGGTGGAGVDPVSQGVLAWSFGKDGKPGKASSGNPNGDNIYTRSDDIISWQ